MVETLGSPREVEPHDALLEEVHAVAGHVAWLREEIRSLEKNQLGTGSPGRSSFRDPPRGPDRHVVGYLAGGLAGGLAMTVGIFLPAFVFPIFFHRSLVALAENPRIRPFLLGVSAGVIGLSGTV